MTRPFPGLRQTTKWRQECIPIECGACGALNHAAWITDLFRAVDDARIVLEKVRLQFYGIDHSDCKICDGEDPLCVAVLAHKILSGED